MRASWGRASVRNGRGSISVTPFYASAVTGPQLPGHLRGWGGTCLSSGTPARSRAGARRAGAPFSPLPCVAADSGRRPFSGLVSPHDRPGAWQRCCFRLRGSLIRVFSWRDTDVCPRDTRPPASRPGPLGKPASHMAYAVCCPPRIAGKRTSNSRQIGAVAHQRGRTAAWAVGRPLGTLASWGSRWRALSRHTSEEAGWSEHLMSGLLGVSNRRTPYGRRSYVGCVRACVCARGRGAASVACRSGRGRGEPRGRAAASVARRDPRAELIPGRVL